MTTALPRTLTPKLIVAEALAQIDAEGLAAFSMRGLARRLGVNPGALYWHVPDRETLLARVADRVIGEVVLPDDALPWEQWLTDFLRAYRRSLHLHPRVMPLISFDLTSNTAGDFPACEGVLACLHRAGFRGAGLVDAFSAVIGMMIGWVGAELAVAPIGVDGWAAARQADLDGIDPAELPHLAALAPQMRNRTFVTRWLSGEDAPLDAGFEATLDVLVRGLRDRATSQRA